MKKSSRSHTCQICHARVGVSDALPAELVHPAVADTIRRAHPTWSSDGVICLRDLRHFRTAHVREILQLERGELTAAEGEVVRSLAQDELLSRNVVAQFDHTETIGERLADRVAAVGGVIAFGFVVVAWISFNSIAAGASFDPYPYILLNLVLSCLAALQAPIIMMSQNRQEAKDRIRSEHDYSVNLKTELEIRHVVTKLDQLLSHQRQRLLEIQDLQMDAMDDLIESRGRGAARPAPDDGAWSSAGSKPPTAPHRTVRRCVRRRCGCQSPPTRRPRCRTATNQRVARARTVRPSSAERSLPRCSRRPAHSPAQRSGSCAPTRAKRSIARSARRATGRVAAATAPPRRRSRLRPRTSPSLR